MGVLPFPAQRFFRAWHSLVLISLLLVSSGVIHAHEIRPTIVDLELQEQGAYQLQLRVNLEALIAGIGAEHEDTDDSVQANEYNRLRALPPGTLQQELTKIQTELLADIMLSQSPSATPPEITKLTIPEVGDTRLARDSVITLTGKLDNNRELQWQWPERYGASVLRINTVQQGEIQELHTAYLQAGQSSEVIALDGVLPETSVWKTFSDYVVIGFAHILPKGLDHILFVVGLFLLSTSISVLLWQVTSFTLAHSVTLALGILGWVQVPGHIVEPLIAASIVYVCLENVFLDRLSRWRPWVIFAFGLLHGLGFASVLGEIGLDSGQFAWGLIGFNVGVELGQLSVILLCFLALGLWFRKRSWYRQVITIPASLVIAGIGVYWVIERVFS